MRLQLDIASKAACRLLPKARSSRLSNQGLASPAECAGKAGQVYRGNNSSHCARQLVICQGSAGYTRRSLKASAAEQGYAEQGFTEPWSIYDNPLLYEAAFLRDFESEVLVITENTRERRYTEKSTLYTASTSG